jgi:hypothetical protein
LIEREDQLRHRRADDDGDRGGHHEQRARACALGRRNPVGEIQHHAGEEARLGDPEHDARDVERRDAGHEHRRHRHESPDDHDPGDPQPRPDALEQQVARDLEQAVAEEEEPGADAVRGVAQMQVALQRRGGEPDVHAVDVGDDVADEREGDEPPCDAGQDAWLVGGGERGRGDHGRGR